MQSVKITRAIKLPIYPRHNKLKLISYTYYAHKKYTRHWINQLYSLPDNSSISTAGMGHLANRAQHKARGILRAHRESVIATGNKSSKPVINNTGCPATIQKNKTSSFDYWVGVSNLFKKGKKVYVPIKSHKRLNKWLRDGYTLAPTAELHKDKFGKFYILAFVQKTIEKATPKLKTIGVDVGINHAVARSDGYLGRSCRPFLKLHRARNAERRRQNHKSKSNKTFLKQMLDVEVKRAVRVAQLSGLSLAFEDPKVLANIKCRGNTSLWAKSYFANRAQIVAQELGVFTVKVFPANTSRTCAKCKHCDGQSRVDLVFSCTACHNRTHADINAARVIAYKGTENIVRIMNYKSGSVLKSSCSSGERCAA